MHSHATPGAMLPSPTQEACLYFLVEMKLCPRYICFAAAEAAEPPPNQRADASDGDLDTDRPMDFDEERG